MNKFIALAILSVLTPQLSFSEEPAIIKIGVIAPLSGNLAEIGETVKNSVTIADQNFDSEDRVQFIFEDDVFSPKNSATAASRLISQEKVAGIIIFGSGTSLAVAPIAESAKIPTITMAFADSLTIGRSYVFRVFMDTLSLAKLIAGEASRRDYKSIATVTTIQDGMLALTKLVLENSKASSLLNEEVAPGDTDLRTVASKIARAKPSAVFLSLLAPQLSTFSKQLRQVGYKGELFSGPPVQSANEVKASGGALIGTWFATQDDRLAKQFYNNYHESFGEVAHPDGIFGYEAARLFINGVSKGDVLKYLTELKEFEGIHGRYHRIEPNIFIPPVAIKTITKDGFIFQE